MTSALRSSSAEVIVVADADCWHDGLDRAVSAVREGAAWAIPHRGVFRLSASATHAYMEGAPLEGLELDQPPYLGLPGGGFVVARRETLLDIPLDPRFVGWGQEDETWGWALATLAGHPWRGKGPLVHLWHPHPKRWTRKYGSPESKRLMLRYQAALDNPAAMRRLLKEADAHLPDQPILHGHSPH